MTSIYNIVTHHERPIEAAEAWISEGVCAVGFFDLDAKNIQRKDEILKLVSRHDKNITHSVNELWKFLQIEKGDIILAYCLNSTVAAVGEIIGDYSYNIKNIVGKDEDDGGFDYPHQKKVKWFETPQYFDKEELPCVISKKLGQRGKTTTKIDYIAENFLKFRELIPSNYKGKFNEDSVKAGISKYVIKNLDKLEIGLKISHEEKSINEQNRPDFLAKDKNGTPVIIECKGYADSETIKQIKRYRSNYPKASRCFLIATRISEDCKKEATKNGIEVFEVDLDFNKITPN
jgi:hypothetical protein